VGVASFGVALDSDCDEPCDNSSCEGFEGRKEDEIKRSLSAISLEIWGKGWSNPRRNGKDCGIAED